MAGKSTKQLNKIQANLNGLLEMASAYGVDKNAMFIAAAEQYAVQQRVINAIKDELDQRDTLMSTKEYVKGRENEYASPLVRELPKHADSANRTLSVMLDIIEKLGKEKPEGGKLQDLMNE